MAKSKSTTKKAAVSKTKVTKAATPTKAASPVKTASPAPKPKKSASTATADRDKVAARAYQIWEEQGKPEGRAAEHWARAEQEICCKR